MFHGSLVALVTPMQADGVIDVDSLRSLVEWHINQGTDGIVVLGTTGEVSTINSAERKLVIEQVLEQTRGRLPVIAGTGTNSTALTVHRTREAMELGVDACLLVTPYYNKPTQEGLYQHFKTVAESVPIPQILYNVPSRTACDLKPATIARLCAFPNIIGVKEATGDVQRLKEIIALVDQSLDLYCGVDAKNLEFLLEGGKGVISVTANVAPKLMHSMCKAVVDKDLTKAKEHDDTLQGLNEQLFIETNPIPTKWALYNMGLIPPGIRLPLTPLSENYQGLIRDALEQAGIFTHSKEIQNEY